jgi:hypothetical protein
MEQHQINEIFESFLKILDRVNHYEIHYFNSHISVDEAKRILDLVPLAEEYLKQHPAKKPMKLKRR